jgi:hypothetical protein
MKRYITLLALLCSVAAYAQDDMQAYLDSLNAAESGKKPKEYTTATFKTTRIVNFPSSETTGKKLLDFRIMHRFGEVYSGSGPFFKDFLGNFFGLDGPAGIKIAFDYGINEWITVGIGRSSYDKIVDGTIKTRILRQTMDGKMPVSLTYQGIMNVTTKSDPRAAQTGVDKYEYFSSRLSYSNTLTLARKFNDKLSLQLNMFHCHFNMVDFADYENDVFAAGISGRIKLTARMALTFEYAYRINQYVPDKSAFQDPFAIGLDIETGGHVFQVHITNGYGINEVQFIPYSTSSLVKGQLRLGFNISRVFTMGKHEGSTW